MIRKASDGSTRMSDDDRSWEAMEFLKKIEDLCVEHGYSIQHEDGHGSFKIVKEEEASAGELMDAIEIIKET